VLLGISDEPGSVEQRPFDLRVRNPGLLRDHVTQDGQVAPVEEVEDSIVHRPEPDAEFENPVTQQICFRPPELMAQFAEPRDPGIALRQRLVLSAVPCDI
jgi:hypothetical protein